MAINSDSQGLIAGDTNNVTDVFVYDRLGGTNALVSESSAGVQGADYSGFTPPAITPDGRFVAFSSNGEQPCRLRHERRP